MGGHVAIERVVSRERALPAKHLVEHTPEREHVRARILRGRADAIISYRNRYQEICVPNIADLPVWNTVETWQPPEREEAPS